MNLFAPESTAYVIPSVSAIKQIGSLRMVDGGGSGGEGLVVEGSDVDDVVCWSMVSAYRSCRDVSFV